MKITFKVLSVVALLGLAAPAIAVTPTPDRTGNERRQRDLNAHSAPGSVPLGDLLRAIWGPDVKSGAAVAINTPDRTPATTPASSSTVFAAAGVVTIKGAQYSLSQCSAISLSGTNTTSTQYRNVSICSNGSTCRAEVGPTMTAPSSTNIPTCADSEVLLGYIALPVSFTGGTTGVTAAMVHAPPNNPSDNVRY